MPLYFGKRQILRRRDLTAERYLKHSPPLSAHGRIRRESRDELYKQRYRLLPVRYAVIESRSVYSETITRSRCVGRDARFPVWYPEFPASLSRNFGRGTDTICPNNLPATT